MPNSRKTTQRAPASVEKKRKKTRGPKMDKSGKVQISISMTPALIEAVEILAAREQRNRSNYIANVLLQIAESEGLI